MMKTSLTFFLFSCLFMMTTRSETSALQSIAEQQDELTADIQELMEIQTNEEVISKLEEVENTMLEATLKLFEGNNTGETLAAQTEVIEKIYEAAKKRQQNAGKKGEQGKGKKPNQAMMEMLEKMMGKPEAKKGESKSAQAGGKKPGGTNGGESSSTETAELNAEQNTTNQPLADSFKRTVPRVTGKVELLIPAEYQSLIEEYNKTK